jgi:hypothetical protein
MNLKRRNKEYQMGSINGLSVKYGTTNKIDPRVVYITGKAWVKPLRKIDYSDSLDRIRNRMEKRIMNRLKTMVGMDKKYIFDLNLSPMNMKVGKPKFMTFNIFLRQDKLSVKSLESIGSVLDVTMSPLIEEMTNDFNDDYFVIDTNKNGKTKENEESEAN